MGQNGTGMAELTIETGPLAGTRFLLDRPLITIGRVEENDIILEDEMLSKNHCRIITQGDNFLIEDLGSSNGTIVNGQQVNTYFLQDGDRVFLGDTTITFHKSALAATSGSPTRDRTRWIWTASAIMGAAVIVAAAVVVLLAFMVLQKDEVRPTVSLQSPAPNQVFDLNMPVPNGKQVTITVSASDDKGLDRIEILSGNDVIKTFKAVKARKESDVTGARQEEFQMTWTSTQGDFSLRARAYDWKGNSGDSEPVSVKVQPGSDVVAAHSYCQQLDQMVMEYSQYRTRFSRAYSKASDGMLDWSAAVTEFTAVAGERRSLLSRLSQMTPPPQFAEAHARFKSTVSCALSADEAAIAWVSAEYSSQYYPSRWYPVTSSTDPGAYRAQVEDWSGQAQTSARGFSAEYDSQRKTQLGIDPGPKP